MASSRKVLIDEVQVTEPDRSKAEEETELSKYSIAQHQVNMPMTDYYEKKYGNSGTKGQLTSNFAQRYMQE